jgi:MFS family permease
MVYPTLLAAIGDVAHPTWRAASIGVYRLWRDGGFAVGALLAGAIADWLGLAAAIWAVAALTGLSGVVVAVRMYETHPKARRQIPLHAVPVTRTEAERTSRRSPITASSGVRLA